MDKKSYIFDYETGKEIIAPVAVKRVLNAIVEQLEDTLKLAEEFTELTQENNGYCSEKLGIGEEISDLWTRIYDELYNEDMPVPSKAIHVREPVYFSDKRTLYHFCCGILGRPIRPTKENAIRTYDECVSTSWRTEDCIIPVGIHDCTDIDSTTIYGYVVESEDRFNEALKKEGLK